ncbi:MAG: 4-hydroxy-tetrahydrodipicolinate synthase [Gemmatimonadota bacterium]|nr:4-hydroxy-tetrahydrodipicolinate synthase [Gemmatimonadota bacterium]
MSERERFGGVGVALVTPFDADGELDLDAFAAHAERMIEGGVDYLVPCGTTGESATMRDSEQVEVIRAAVRVSNGRVPVLAGAGANATSEAVARTRGATEAGADGILSVAPYYNKPPQEGLFRHFEAVAQATDLPVVLYNVPGRTSSNILPETVFRLTELPNVVGIKEACGDLDQLGTLLRGRPEGFLVLAGDDEITLPLLAMGGDGLISVIANEAPAEITALVHAGLEGDFSRARSLHYRLLELMRCNFVETNPIPVKTAVEMLGGPPTHFRSPLVPLSEGARERLRAALDASGISSFETAGR